MRREAREGEQMAALGRGVVGWPRCIDLFHLQFWISCVSSEKWQAPMLAILEFTHYTAIPCQRSMKTGKCKNVEYRGLGYFCQFFFVSMLKL